MSIQTRRLVKRLAAISFLMAIICLVVFEIPRPIRNTTEVATSPVPAELSRMYLVFEEGRWRERGNAAPFTGVMLELYADGLLRSRSALVNGLLNGLSEGWYTNGQIQVSEHFKDGVSNGLRTKWYPGGSKQSEANIVDGKLHGIFRRWHENGALSEQLEFVNGRPEGVSVSYFPSGCLKGRVVFKNTKPVEQQFWKDGERKS